MDEIRLRQVQDADLEAFFAHQQDPLAIWMAAFTPEDPADRVAFDKHWTMIRSSPAVVVRTIVTDGRVAGYVTSFPEDERTEVSYWIDRAVWGRHIATRALTAFLPLVLDRPLHARAAKDNAGSLAVLRHCGFTIIGTDSGYANGRRELTDEYLLRLD